MPDRGKNTSATSKRLPQAERAHVPRPDLVSSHALFQGVDSLVLQAEQRMDPKTFDLRRSPHWFMAAPQLWALTVAINCLLHVWSILAFSPFCASLQSLTVHMWLPAFPASRQASPYLPRHTHN